MNAAYDDSQQLDFGAQVIALCERFHCLPWELEGHDIGQMLHDMRLLDVYRIGIKQRNGEKLSQDEDIELGELLNWEIERERA